MRRTDTTQPADTHNSLLLPRHVLPNNQVILYDGLSRQVRRTFSRFKDTAYSGSLRNDGKLLVAGGQNGIVQVRLPGGCCCRGVLLPGCRAALAASGPSICVRSGAGKGCCPLAGKLAGQPAKSTAMRLPAQSHTYVRMTGSHCHCCCTQVFDAGSRSVLRQLKGHSRPVHVTRFASDKTHVLSGGDDVTLRWWDISSGKQLLRLVGHEDYVRAAAASTSSSDTWASGEGKGCWPAGLLGWAWAAASLGGVCANALGEGRVEGNGQAVTPKPSGLSGCMCVLTRLVTSSSGSNGHRVRRLPVRLGVCIIGHSLAVVGQSGRLLSDRSQARRQLLTTSSTSLQSPHTLHAVRYLLCAFQVATTTQ